MHNCQHKIAAHSDFEFNSLKTREIDYSIMIPSGVVTGLVVFIAGFGDDAGAYRVNFQKHICTEYSMACLTVNYHCFFSRPNNGAQIIIESSTEKLLRSLTGYENGEEIKDLLIKANSLKADPTTPLKIPGTIVPANDEYQNFGILPALDNLYAIYDALERYPGIPKKIYAIGSSYGGYLANIITKLAPCTINAVFDNSSWAIPNMNYMIGHDLGQAEFLTTLMPDITLELNVLSPWSKYSQLPNAFTKEKLLMRSFPNHHLDVMKKIGGGKTVYRFVHSENDYIANTQEKINLAKDMIDKGFNVQMEVYSEADIDGSYIKNMTHGMGLSLQKFFAICFKHSHPDITDDQRTDFDFNHSCRFVCDSISYFIDYQQAKPPLCKISHTTKT